mgnify:CR=1 FL=1
MLTKEACLALKKVQKELNKEGLGLKIYDSYRPTRAVDEFMKWGKDLKEQNESKEEDESDQSQTDDNDISKLPLIEIKSTGDINNTGELLAFDGEIKLIADGDIKNKGRDAGMVQK